MPEVSPLEQQFSRLVPGIVSVWGSPACYDHLLDLLIDRRGGRRGFPEDVHSDLAFLLTLTPRPQGPYDIWTETVDTDE